MYTMLSPSTERRCRQTENKYEDRRKELITDRRYCSPVLNREEWHDCNGINSSV